MAIDMSHRFAKKLKLPNLPVLHARIALRRQVAKSRDKRREALRESLPRREGVPCRISQNFEAQAEHFRTHGWAFIDGMFEDEFWQSLVTHWPDRAFFIPPKTVKKGYDYGFHWTSGKDATYEDGTLFPEVQSMRDTMDSPEMAKRVQAFTGWDHALHCNSVLCTHSYPGTCVIPHRDTVAEASQFPSINFIFFVNGTGGPRSGGLALSNDNELNDVFFEPTKLKNTCLVYNTAAPFYHGFEPMAWNKFRWMMSAHFAGPDQFVPH
jgi:hypothetical protein